MESGSVIWVDLQTAPTTVDLSVQVGLLCQLYKIRDIDKVANSIRALTPHTVFFEFDDPSAELLALLKGLVSDFRKRGDTALSGEKVAAALDRHEG